MTTAASGPLVLAFDVGGTSVKSAVLDTALRPLTEARRPSRPGPAILEVIGAAADELLGALAASERARVVAAGVVMPGLADKEAGVAVRSVNLDLADVDIAGPLAQRWGLQVRFGHDVQAAGEAVRRSTLAVNDPCVVVLGTGIAAVTFVGGEPVRGVSGQAGELGHVVVRPGGPVCQCGARGCLEAIAGARAIVRAYRDATGCDIEGAKAVVERAEADPIAAAIWREAVSALADALVTVCALVAPGGIVLAGGLSGAGEALTGPLHATMTERSHVAAVPPIVISPLGSRAGLVGAAHLALDLVAETGAARAHLEVSR